MADSLSILTITSKLNSRGISIPTQSFYKYFTIEKIANSLDQIDSIVTEKEGIAKIKDKTDSNDYDFNEIMEQIVLYSIVNSLTELPDVQKVQLSINGDSSGNLRFNYSLSELYERDDSLIVSSNADTVQLSTEEE